MKKRATAAVQNAMAGCLNWVVIVAVLMCLLTAALGSWASRNAVATMPARTSQAR